MSDGVGTNPCASPTVEFLAALRRSEVLPEERLLELEQRMCQGDRPPGRDAVAKELVREGALTEFQADRLLYAGGRGLLVGRYVVIDRVGSGAMGVVYKARHKLMDRVVALKVISPKGSFGAAAVPRFLREMKIVGLLDHPNVVRAYDADEAEGMSYLVMEFITGEDLDRMLMRRGPLPEEEVVGYIAQAARGLTHAHEKGVIHRDIKPSNLAVDASGVLKVLDLGLGAFLDPGGDSPGIRDHLDRGLAVGTADFMSPEQVQGEPLDGRSDLFSLGCTMYRLITGAYPYPGADRVERLIKRVDSPYVPITDVRPGVRFPVVDVLDRLLARSPADRYATAAEAADALDALSAPAGRGGRAAAAKPVRVVEPEPAPLDWRRIETALVTSETPEVSEAVKVPRPARAPGEAGTRRLEAHRKSLEADGEETGREVHSQYRAELIRLNRDIAEGRGAPQEKVAAPADERWIRWLEHHLGTFDELGAGFVTAVIALIGIGAAVAITLALR